MSQIDCLVYKMLENKDWPPSQVLRGRLLKDSPGASEQQKNMSMLRFHLSAAAVRLPAGCFVLSHGFLTAGSKRTHSAESLFTCCFFLQGQRTHRLQENKIKTVSRFSKTLKLLHENKLMTLIHSQLNQSFNWSSRHLLKDKIFIKYNKLVHSCDYNFSSLTNWYL